MKTLTRDERKLRLCPAFCEGGLVSLKQFLKIHSVRCVSKTLYPFSVSFVVMSVLQIIYPDLVKGLSPSELVSLAVILFIPIFVFFEAVDWYFYKRNSTLASKIMNCTLRKEQGHDDCAGCPDGYTCPDDSGVE